MAGMNAHGAKTLQAGKMSAGGLKVFPVDPQLSSPALSQTKPSGLSAATVAPKAASASASHLSPDLTGESLTQDSQNLRERLDFKPRLSFLDKAVCLLAPAGVCSLLYLGLQPRKISPMYALGTGLIYAAWIAITRAFLLERQYTKRLVSVEDLGDPDSHFPVIDGLKVHAKAFGPKHAAVKARLHCFHGFGANVESWEAVQKRIAEQTSTCVSSHDKPGFGLTERPIDPHKYSTEFNAFLGRSVMDLEDEKIVKEGGSSQGSGKRVKRVLMGHSMGAGSAAAEAISNPEDVDALILVAPAIRVFDFLLPPQSGKSGVTQRDGQCQTAQFPSAGGTGVVPQRTAQGNRLKRLVFATTRAILGRFSRFISTLLAPVTVVGLRASVRSRAFWENGLARAWYDKTKLTPKIVDAYRKPQLVKGWERGLVNFTSSRVGGGAGIMQVIKDAWNGRIRPLQAEELAAVVAKRGTKVLIVHGKQDKVIAAKNSQKLAALIPNSRLVIWDETGHLPHEEHPERFIALTETFLQSL